MTRRWKPGMRFEVDGIYYQTARGRHHEDDVVLQHLVNGEWRNVPMHLGALLADFFYENEDVLYPPPYRGGRYYLQYIHHAARHGWDKADAQMRLEKRQRRAQDKFVESEGGAA